MNICLIYPLLSKERSRIDENKQFWPPLGLAYIAAVLEKDGHIVRIIDRDALLRKNNLDFELTDKITCGVIDDMNSDMVGIGGTTPTFRDALHIAGLVKRRNSKRTLIFGGPHATGEPVTSLQDNPFIDILVRGEGEFAMLELAGGRQLVDIDGISFRNNGRIIMNHERALYPNLDDIPFPARHLLDMHFYTRPSRFISRNLTYRTTSIFTARGCPYRCNYCAGPLMFDGKVRFHSAERVISEIKELVDRYFVEGIYFAEDMFLSNRGRAKEFMFLLRNSGLNRKIKWFAQIRSNVIDEELLHLMKLAGCVHVEYGFESGSQRVLDIMNKRAKVEDNLNAARLTRKAGLRFQANIIVGYPGEKEEDFCRTIDFIKQTRPNSVGFNIFMPLPGTAIYNKLKEGGKTIPPWDEIGDPEGTRVCYADMSRQRFYELYLTTRLTVILPINLYYFIKDNLVNPLRLAWIIVSQFRGVIIKTIRSIARLLYTKKTYDILYVSYNALSDLVFQSQGIVYLAGLGKAGFSFLLLTFEKDNLAISGADDFLRKANIDSRSLKYHKKPYLFSTLWDILCGNIYLAFILCRYRISIIHARGVISAMMSFIPALIYSKKFVFDIRSSLAEAYASGRYWSRKSIIYKLIRSLEQVLILLSDFVVVETTVHANGIRGLWPNKKPSTLQVIPCCVDLERFKSGLLGQKKSFNLERGKNFKLLYIGSLAAWYMLNEMLEFFLVLNEIMPNSNFLFFTQDRNNKIMNRLYRANELTNFVKVEFVKFNELPMRSVEADAAIVFTRPNERLESMPVKIGEYLGSGLPVVLNKGMGDAEELVRSNNVGVIVESFTRGSYEKAISELMELSKDETLRRRCRTVAQDYLSLEMGIQRYSDIYKGLNDVK
jgi:anaerobic magnesium-protoporphyrin IX monomethyl ester cyclase